MERCRGCEGVGTLVEGDVFGASNGVQVDVPSSYRVVEVVGEYPLVVHLPHDVCVLSVAQFVLDFCESFLVGGAVFRGVFVAVLRGVINDVGSVNLVPVRLAWEVACSNAM